MCVMLSNEWVTQGLCDGGQTVCGTCGARATPIPSVGARALSVGKTPSFSFCPVDMYGVAHSTPTNDLMSYA